MFVLVRRRTFELGIRSSPSGGGREKAFPYAPLGYFADDAACAIIDLPRVDDGNNR